MRASEITPKAVEWLHFPYVPLGKISAVAGQMGQAKSLWTMWLAAAVTRGEGINLGRPGTVIVLNAEDDPEDTIRPRLEAAGADLDRVWIEPGVTLDATRLDRLCDELPDVRLVTVDPIQAYMPPNVNSWKGQDVRRALEPARTLAARRSLAVVLVQHLNRRSDAGDPLARIADSQGIPQLARSVLVWGPDPSDPEGDQGTSKVLTRAKGNLTRSTASASYTIVERDLPGGLTVPALVRGADQAVSADDVVSDHETRTAVDEAAAWLRNLLADGPVKAKDATRQARDVGIADRTLKRAKRIAGVTSEASRDDNGFTGWTWALRPINVNGTLGTLGTVGPLGPTQEAKEAKGANSSNNNGRALSAIYGPLDDEEAVA